MILSLWIILALLIAGLVMITGLFDLIWLSMAALLTSLVVWILPGLFADPVMSFIVFALSACLLVIAGRFIRFSAPAVSGLNDRVARTVGEIGPALDDFDAGRGHIRLGDSQWRAEADKNTGPIAMGDTVTVVSYRESVLIVRPARSEADRPEE